MEGQVLKQKWFPNGIPYESEAGIEFGVLIPTGNFATPTYRPFNDRDSDPESEIYWKDDPFRHSDTIAAYIDPQKSQKCPRPKKQNQKPRQRKHRSCPKLSRDEHRHIHPRHAVHLTSQIASLSAAHMAHAPLPSRGHYETDLAYQGLRGALQAPSSSSSIAGALGVPVTSVPNFDGEPAYCDSPVIPT